MVIALAVLQRLLKQNALVKSSAHRQVRECVIVAFTTKRPKAFNRPHKENIYLKRRKNKNRRSQLLC